MLLNFKIENFKSFKEEISFDLRAGITETHPELVHNYDNGANVLKFAALFGPNGGGKTNFIKAIDFSKFVITKKVLNVTKSEINKFSGSDVIKFEYMFEAKNNFYEYKVSLNTKRSEIIEEQLTLIKSNTTELIFKRNLLEVDFSVMNDLNSNDKLRVNINLENLKSNQTIIKLLSDKKMPVVLKCLKDVYDFFNEKIVVIYPDSKIRNLAVDENKVRRLEIFKNLDLKIDSYEKVKISEEDIVNLGKETFDLIKKAEEIISEKFKNKQNKESQVILLNDTYLFEYNKDENDFEIYKLLYKYDGEEFKYHEYSDGSKKVIEFSDVLISSKDKIYFIDEIDRSLHPLLTKKVIDIILKNQQEAGGQLITTTHETIILANKFYRRDCFWFVDGGKGVKNNLVSLDQFKIRKDLKISKAYIEGRFGFLPNLFDKR